MTVRRNLTVTLASLANTTAQLDQALATIQGLNEATVANFTVEVGLYSGYVAVGLTGIARLAWLQWKKEKIFPLDRLNLIYYSMFLLFDLSHSIPIHISCYWLCKVIL